MNTISISKMAAVALLAGAGALAMAESSTKPNQGAAKDPAAAHLKGSPDAGAPDATQKLRKDAQADRSMGSATPAADKGERRDAARNPGAAQLKNSPDAGVPKAGTAGNTNSR